MGNKKKKSTKIHIKNKNHQSQQVIINLDKHAKPKRKTKTRVKYLQPIYETIQAPPSQQQNMQNQPSVSSTQMPIVHNLHHRDITQLNENPYEVNMRNQREEFQKQLDREKDALNQNAPERAIAIEPVHSELSSILGTHTPKTKNDPIYLPIPRDFSEFRNPLFSESTHSHKKHESETSGEESESDSVKFKHRLSDYELQLEKSNTKGAKKIINDKLLKLCEDVNDEYDNKELKKYLNTKTKRKNSAAMIKYIKQTLGI